MEEFTCNLIEAVQMHACIYDKSLPAYKSRLAKEAAWDALASATGKDVKACNARWRSIRDRYVKEKFGMYTPSESAPSEREPWKHMAALAFLQRHIEPRKTIGNTSFKYASKPKQITREEKPVYSQQTQPVYVTASYSQPTYVFDDEQTIYEEQTSQPVYAFNQGQSNIQPQPVFQKVEGNHQSQPVFVECYDEDPLIAQSQCAELLTASSISPPLTSAVGLQHEERVTPSKASKRKKDVEKFDTLCGAVTDWLKKSEPNSRPTSRNNDFFNVLDTYLLKLEEDVQDRMKIDILNFVFSGGQSSLL